jgi:lysylphosphatidylglycerol synthetase-like protein (DUF2156 family)
MSENLERWKAGEQVRAHIGWFAVYTGLGGAVLAAGALVLLVLRIAGVGGNHRVTVAGVPILDGSGTLVVLLMGVAALVCARGLWKVRPWARWATLAFFAGTLVLQVLELVRERELEWGLCFTLSPIVYLLLPSTARCFARAQGPLPAADAS